jgi:hypothetical protein
MENIHVLLTDKPSKLYQKDGNFKLDTSAAIDWFISSAGYKPQNIYITSDEEITGFENNIWVIKGERIFLWQNTMALVSNNKPRQIILTTDQDLIKNGVQAIDDEFLEWFVKNQSCESVEVLRCPIEGLYTIIPKEEAKMTAEDFFRKKLKELNPIQTVITLSRELITAEQGMRWAKEYSDYISK